MFLLDQPADQKRWHLGKQFCSPGEAEAPSARLSIWDAAAESASSFRFKKRLAVLGSMSSCLKSFVATVPSVVLFNAPAPDQRAERRAEERDH